METKRCPAHNDGAGEILPASAFYVVKNRQGKDVLAGYCRDCSKRIAIAYHQRHKDKANATVRASRKKHPETDRRHGPYRIQWARNDKSNNPEKWVNRYRRHGWKKVYGITPEWYEAKLAEQGGACAMCPNTVSDVGRWLAIDHCHQTNQIRGILCGRCNNSLERLEVEGWLEKALAYLERYKNDPDKLYAPIRTSTITA